MKDNKSPGLDSIPLRLLIETAQQIRIPVARETNILPLLKKNISRNKYEIYSPVSSTSVISKLLERLIINHMEDLKRLKILSRS